MPKMVRQSRSRSFVKRLYTVPGLGYFVRLAVAFARLPATESYHAALLRNLEQGFGELRQELGELRQQHAGQAELLAEVARHLEKFRADQAALRADAERHISRLDRLVPKLLSGAAVNGATVRRLKDLVLAHEEQLSSLGEERLSSLEKVSDRRRATRTSPELDMVSRSA